MVAAAVPIRARPWIGYALALVLSIVITFARFIMHSALDGFPYLLPVLVVIVSAFLGGRGPGILATLLAGGLAKFFFMQPVQTLALEWPSGWIGTGFYLVLCAIITLLVHAMFAAYEKQKRTQAALATLNLELEARVEERTSELAGEMADRTQAQAQLRQLQKTEAIGQLTGGIAHDFNNMLAVVIGSLDMARRRLEQGKPEQVLRSIDNAGEGAKRAALLTARLLAFSRQQPLSPKALDANELVTGMIEMLRRTLGEHMMVETDLAKNLWPTFADAGQLENAVLNLAINARDAMPGGGKLTIETSNAHLDERYALAHVEVTAGSYVLISVSDSGTGMTPEVIGRAFDPFYTTKEVGRGTGLGLSQVFGFIKQSGGHVKIYSEVGHGTTMKLYLPRAVGLTEGRDMSDPQTPAFPVGSRKQTILVVEDDAQVRQMSVDALNELGFTVVQAADAKQALEQLGEQPRVDLLFTDIVMPGMSGRELGDRVRAEFPTVRILFTTGYTRDAVIRNGMLADGVAFLPKPFTMEQIAWTVRDALADTAG